MVVVYGNGDDRPRTGHDVLDIAAPLGITRHPPHAGLKALQKPFQQAAAVLGDGPRIGNPEKIESQLNGSRGEMRAPLQWRQWARNTHTLLTD